MNRQLKTKIQPLLLHAVFTAELPLWPRISLWLKESASRERPTSLRKPIARHSGFRRPAFHSPAVHRDRFTHGNQLTGATNRTKPKQLKSMKLKCPLPRCQIVWAIASTLWMAFPAMAQNTASQTVTSSITDGNKYTGTATYNYSMTVTLSGPDYVTYDNAGTIQADISAATSTSTTLGTFPPAPRGTDVEYFGTGGQIGEATIGEQPFMSKITLQAPDTFGGSTCPANISTGLGGNWNFSFSIKTGNIGIGFSPPPPGCPISLQGNGFNEIDLADSVNVPLDAYDAASEDGVFGDGGTVSLGTSGNFEVLESTNGTGQDMGTCTIQVTMNCANVLDGAPPVSIEPSASSKSVSLTLHYIRGDHLLDDNHPTLTASASPSQVATNQTTTITVQIYNPSPDLSTANGVLYFSGIGLPPGTTPVPPQYQGIWIPPLGSVTNTFQISSSTPGTYDPVINFQTGWKAPVPASVTLPLPISTNAPFTVTAPNITVDVHATPSGPSFTVDGTTYSAERAFSWAPGTSHTLGVRATQYGGPDVQYLWNNWSDLGAVSHTVSPTSGTTYTANFTTQYFLTMAAGAGGGVSPGSGWTDAGTSVSISATANSGYRFTDWTGTGAGSYSGSSSSSFIAMNSPITETADFVAAPPLSFGPLSRTGNELQTTLSGLSSGEQVVLEVSTDLTNWTPLQTNTANEPTLTFTIPINPALQGQYFRATAQ